METWRSTTHPSPSTLKQCRREVARRARLLALACGALAWLALSSAPAASRGSQETPANLTLLTRDGGRVAWYHGARHELIAYDAVVSGAKRNTEVFVMNPDGSGQRCVTCNSSIPKGFVGQPEWHPDGEHLILQAEGAGSKHGLFNHQSWGIDNDLWIVKTDGSGARRIWASEPGRAALHPHVSDDGRTLTFAERVPTNRKLSGLGGLLGPGGENQWDGWRLHVAALDLAKDGTGALSNHRTLQPSGSGFYETNQIIRGRIVYSHTAGGRPYVANVYEVGLDGSGVRQLTDGDGSWNEHGQYSPDGRAFAFMSSRFKSSWHYPGSTVRDLATELYVSEGGGPPRQLTRMNEMEKRAVVVSDYDWDRDGRRIVMQVAEISGRTTPRIWLLVLK